LTWRGKAPAPLQVEMDCFETPAENEAGNPVAGAWTRRHELLIWFRPVAQAAPAYMVGLNLKPQTCRRVFLWQSLKLAKNAADQR